MGGQAASQQVDPAIQQITEFISTSIDNGEDPVEVVMSLVDQEVDQETIAQVFMQVGYAEEDVVALFEQVQQKMQPPGPASAEQQTQDPQEITRNESMAEESQMQQAKSGIEIKPENKGKFTSWAEARGMSVQAAASKVMSNTDEYPLSVVKMANFAKNAAGWNKQEGGDVSNYTEGVRQREGSYNPPNRKYTLDPRFKKEGGEFEPHFMYKGERKIRAKDMATHLRLKKAGYGHNAPKAQTGLEVDKKGNIFIDGVVQAGDEWTASAPGYVNPLAFESGDNFSLTDGLQVLGTGINKMLGSGDKNKDGLKDGFFRDVEEKRGLRNLKKGDYYNYEIELDPNDPNAYGYDNLDLYNASIGEGGLRNLQTFTDDVNENSRLNYNTKTGKYDALMSSRELDKSIFGNLNAFTGENLNYFNNVDDETKQQLIDYGNSFKNGTPKGTTLSIDPETGSVSYVNPDTDNPNEYNTMMGYNKYGKKEVPKSMIPTNVDGQPVASMNNTPPRVPQLSFQEWSMQDSVRRTGANAPQQYQDYLNQFKEGGSLPKAQVGLGMFNFDFLNNLTGFTEDQLKDQENYFANLFSGQTNYKQDIQDVADAQLQTKQPDLGPTPLEQKNLGLFTAQTDQEEENEINTFDDPTVKRTNKFQGGFNRFMDSPGMKGYTGGSEFAVQGARVLNNFFDDRAIEDAQADNRNNMVADNLYATKENPMLKRGAWDINTGTFGSEGQRTVRTNMGIAQEGGEMATVDSLLLAKLIAAGADIEIL